MEVIEVIENKKAYIALLLLADEQEDMIDRYLDKGKMYVLDDNGIKCECVVTNEGNGVLEIKNIATFSEYQGKGYEKFLIDFIAKKYKGKYNILQVNVVLFVLISYQIFIDNYANPIYENGVQLVDIVYLKRAL